MNENTENTELNVDVQNSAEVNTETANTDAVNAGVKKNKDGKKKKSAGRELFEWVYSIAIAIVIAVLIKGFLFDVVRVDGQSMYPTLHDNDRLIVTKLGYEPEQGDIIILDSNYRNREQYYDSLAQSMGKTELSWLDKIKVNFSLPSDCKRIYYVKRIIATEGQTVDIRDGKVFVDGVELDEPYFDGETYPTDAATVYPFTVSEDCVFVMGDNRGNSKDSRVASLGEIKDDAILGKSQIRVYPFDSIGKTE